MHAIIVGVVLSVLSSCNYSAPVVYQCTESQQAKVEEITEKCWEKSAGTKGIIVANTLEFCNNAAIKIYCEVER